MPRAAAPGRLGLLVRSERYRRLDALPAIRSRTDFFAAASIVTRVLAYSGATRFMVTLSDALERANVSRARLICSGLLYVTGSVERRGRRNRGPGAATDHPYRGKAAARRRTP